MTASNPFVRLATAASDLASAVMKFGESAVVRISGKERQALATELRQAQAVGQFTVLMASSKAKNAINDLKSKIEQPAAPEFAGEPQTPAASDTHEIHETLPTPQSIADYDSLTASQIVSQLAELTEGERSEILAYEQANRGRNSILKEISKLA